VFFVLEMLIKTRFQQWFCRLLHFFALGIVVKILF
jgi:hypothetical protein